MTLPPYFRHEGPPHFKETTNAPIEATFALIKPDATESRVVGQVISQFIEPSFIISDMHVDTWTKRFAEWFYEEHAERPFFGDLVTFMTSGPIYALTLIRPGAVKRWREILGHTDPRSASPWTVRGAFGNRAGIVMRNVAHGSDSTERAKEEIALYAASQYNHHFGQNLRYDLHLAHELMLKEHVEAKAKTEK